MTRAAKHRSAIVLVVGSALALVFFGATLGLGRSFAKDRIDDTSASSATTHDTVNAYETYSVFLNRPVGPPRIETGIFDDLGRQVSVSCMSCHANFEPNTAIRSGEQLTEFHQGLHFDHGGMTCLSCHHADNYNALRRADGSQLPFENVQNLCAQCHAPQARDFERGAHGGMTGYWDLSRGPQHRKSCIDCHDPHAPAFPHMHPAFKPIDRFLDQHDHGH